MDHRNFKIFAAYFLINEIIEKTECCDECCHTEWDLNNEKFLDQGILFGRAVADIISTLTSSCEIMNSISKTPLGEAALYILCDEIDEIGITFSRCWVLESQYFYFFNEYVAKSDKALRTILIENFIYAPLCKYDCAKECALHCNNRCKWDKDENCQFGDHENPHPDEIEEDVDETDEDECE